jgi:hypothetical protein
MSKTKMQTRKFFDIQYGQPKMPKEVKSYFFERETACNDVWVEYTVGISLENGDELDILDQWLMDNFDVTDGEEIFLSHWW